MYPCRPSPEAYRCPARTRERGREMRAREMRVVERHEREREDCHHLEISDARGMGTGWFLPPVLMSAS